jgi:hypothetical protein
MSRDTYMSSFRHIGPGALAGAHEVGSLVIRIEGSLPAPTAQALPQSVRGFGVRRPMHGERVGLLVNAAHRDRRVC